MKHPAGTITFETSHFSEYAVVIDNSLSSGNSQGMLLLALLIAAIVAPIAIAMVVYRKN